jgi:phosphohistidine phosphatase
MKTLHLVRHAKSSWDNPQLSDFKRPLNDRGLRDAPNMGRVIKEKIRGQVQLISSPAIRAITTARLMSEQLDMSSHQIETHPNLYHGEPGSMLYVLSKISDKFHEIVLFGHNPGLTDFGNELQHDEFIENIPTAGILGIGLNIHSWAELSKRPIGELLYFDFPKKFL